MSLTLIEKLYAQSFRTSSGIPTSEMNTITSEDIIFVPEKFAELIVQECIDYCGENLSKTVGDALKIHFGVAE